MPPVQITFHGLDHSDTLEARIRERLAQLERLHPYITSCRVAVEVPHQRHHRGQLFAVHLVIHVPDAEIAVSREPQDNHAHEDAAVALRDAFDSAARQLSDYHRHRHNKVKKHASPDHGVVSRLFRDDGYGFVTLPDGLDVYFHENSVVGANLAALRVGSPVRVVIAEGEGARGPQASTITPIGKHHPVARV